MNNLISSEFIRLFKSKTFYVTLCSLVVSVVLEALMTYIPFMPTDEGSTSYPILLVIAVSIFISMFVRKDFSHGTIRNKLISGYSKASVYLSYLIVCIAAGIIMQIVCMITGFVVEIVINFQYDMDSINEFYGSFSNFLSDFLSIKTQLVGLFVTAAYSAIFLMITVLCDSGGHAAAASMTAAIVLLIFGDVVNGTIYFQEDNAFDESYNAMIERLDEKYFDNFKDPDIDVDYPAYIKEFGIEYGKLLNEKRGRELSEPKRSIYFVLEAVLPSAQIDEMLLYSNHSIFSPTHILSYILCDCGVIFVFSAIGISLFKRKDVY